MSRTIIGAMAAAAVMGFASTALACAPLAIIDQTTGERFPESSPRGLAYNQANYRARSASVFLAQVSAVRMVSQNDLVFTLTPITALYGTPLPAANVSERRDMHQTCARVELEPGQFVIVYAAEADDGLRPVGFASLEGLQDRPPELPTARQIERGLYPLPTYGD